MNDRQPPALTTVRQLTATAAAAIATIAIEGPQAADVVAASLISSTGQAISLDQPGARFARWRFTDHQLADEHVVVLVRGPSSIEIHCHGGVTITELIVQQLRSALERSSQVVTRSIASQSQPSFEEAIHEAAHHALIHATTLKSALVLLDQYHGALEREFRLLKALITQKRFDEAQQLRAVLVERAKFGTRLLNPWRLTLAGPPNVGKSSLMNSLCGSSRVLVHHEPGTTRDAIDTALVISGWPLVLTDTAGMRHSTDQIEQQGVQTALQRWQRADIGLMVIDATVGWTADHARLLAGPSAIIVVINKIDVLSGRAMFEEMANSIRLEIAKSSNVRAVVGASTLQDDGISALVQTIGDHLDYLQPPSGSGVPFNTEQLEWLDQMYEACQTGRD